MTDFIKKYKPVVSIFLILIIFLTIYSYALVDPNITFINHPLWTHFRNFMVILGYYHRLTSALIFIFLITGLFVLHLLIGQTQINPLKIACAIGLVTLFSYPFLSHDFFNYLFDAKILTFYHKNPYFFKALDFSTDSWLRFMHWTHRTYPYGPVFLALSAIPSFLSFGKLVLSFFFFKSMYLIFYLLSVMLLARMNNKWALIYATHPMIIVEGLINSHNDFIALSLAAIGIYFFMKRKKSLIGLIIMLFSSGIKYITAPLLLISKNPQTRWISIIFLLQVLILIFITIKGEIQPWYFLALFAFIPFFEKLILRINIFFFGLLLSYYPYIRLGGWDTMAKIQMKHTIIWVFFVINMIYLIFIFLRKKSLIR